MYAIDRPVESTMSITVNKQPTTTFRADMLEFIEQLFQTLTYYFYCSQLRFSYNSTMCKVPMKKERRIITETQNQAIIAASKGSEMLYKLPSQVDQSRSQKKHIKIDTHHQTTFFPTTHNQNTSLNHSKATKQGSSFVQSFKT